MNGILERTPCEPLLGGGVAHARPGSRLWRIWCALAVRGWERVRQFNRRARERRMLGLLVGRMSEHELRDLGVTRQRLAWEANKPFWRA